MQMESNLINQLIRDSIECVAYVGSEQTRHVAGAERANGLIEINFFRLLIRTRSLAATVAAAAAVASVGARRHAVSTMRMMREGMLCLLHHSYMA